MPKRPTSRKGDTEIGPLRQPKRSRPPRNRTLRLLRASRRTRAQRDERVLPYTVSVFWVQRVKPRQPIALEVHRGCSEFLKVEQATGCGGFPFAKLGIICFQFGQGKGRSRQKNKAWKAPARGFRRLRARARPSQGLRSRPWASACCAGRASRRSSAARRSGSGAFGRCGGAGLEDGRRVWSGSSWVHVARLFRECFLLLFSCLLRNTDWR